ncbi:OmpA family protein [Tropicimonas sp. IMCC34043]|uniref:OmpA family protein n=1 Tax=Tropicimonas sp. IMCC34043 TaxID=2248760 RepID=UPI001300AEE3|nr:OmpA family protein [Tropicimonas sp. IMCC34043]
MLSWLLDFLTGVMPSVEKWIGPFESSLGLGIAIILFAMVLVNIAVQLLPAVPDEQRGEIYGTANLVVAVAVAVVYFAITGPQWQIPILRTACGMLLLAAALRIFWCVSVRNRFVFRCGEEGTHFLRGTTLTPQARRAIADAPLLPPPATGAAAGDPVTPPPAPQSDADFFCNHVGREPGQVWTAASYRSARRRLHAVYVATVTLFAAGLALGAVAANLPAYTVTQTPEAVNIDLSAEVLFDTAKAELRPGSQYYLQQVAQAIAARRPVSVSIEGHTDSRGSAEFNLELSQARAEAVRTWLVDDPGGPRIAGVPIAATGFGETRLKVPEESGADRGGLDPAALQANRRVEIVLRY